MSGMDTLLECGDPAPSNGFSNSYSADQDLFDQFDPVAGSQVGIRGFNLRFIDVRLL